MLWVVMNVLCFAAVWKLHMPGGGFLDFLNLIGYVHIVVVFSYIATPKSVMLSTPHKMAILVSMAEFDKNRWDVIV